MVAILFLFALILTDVILFFWELPIAGFLKKLIHFLTGHLQTQERGVDDNGIPWIIYAEVGKVHNPLFVGREIISLAALAKQGDELAQVKMINCCDWMISQKYLERGAAYIPYQFDDLHYNLKKPWISGLSQAVSMLCFAKAFDVTANQDYQTISRQFLKSFLIDNNKITNYDEEKMPWFEEYPQAQGKSSHVLNGMMSTLICFDEYTNLEKSAEAEDLFKQGMKSLIKYLPHFNRCRYLSYYDLQGNIAGRNYQQYHVELLTDLYRRTGSLTLLNQSKQWMIGLRLPILVQNLLAPRARRLVQYIIILLFMSVLLIIGYILISKRFL
jgi:hypothetical protein